MVSISRCCILLASVRRKSASLVLSWTSYNFDSFFLSFSLFRTIEYLDDASRQPQISFSSRLPHAFPLTDAISLQSNLVTFNPHDPVFVKVMQHHDGPINHKKEGLKNCGIVIPIDFALHIDHAAKIMYSSIHLLTSHNNGSLNLWQIGTDEDTKFSSVYSVAHMNRMCGHRYEN